MRAKTRRALTRAIELYRSFREAEPERVQVIDYDPPAAVMVIGHLEAVDYKTTHGRKAVTYRHTFAPGSRPLLCVSADGRQLMLFGGRYRFTDRGIVDRNARGEEIDEPAHGEPV